MKMVYGDRFFYILYFQQPSVRPRPSWTPTRDDSMATVLCERGRRGLQHGRDRSAETAADGGHRLPDDHARAAGAAVRRA